MSVLSLAFFWLAFVPASEVSADAADPAWPQGIAFRHQEAFRQLGSALDGFGDRLRIYYAASGSHVGPLAMLAGASRTTSVSLDYQDLDSENTQRLAANLARLAKAGVIQSLEESAGGWKFTMGKLPVRLHLSVVPNGTPLFSPAILASHDAVILHDFSGDPLVLLRLIKDFLVAARQSKARPSRLFIEDLSAHPYPLDMAFFSPVVRTGNAYGHQDGEAEDGVPLFGGAVGLSFAGGWWRRVDEATLTGFFDFLFLSEFDTDRRNVLEGGSEPILAPAPLDWYTGFGYRSIAGFDFRTRPELREQAVAAALRVLRELREPLKEQMTSRLLLYRSLAAYLAAGGRPDAVGPVVPRFRIRPPREFAPSVRSLYEQAVSKSRDFRRAGQGRALLMRRLVERLDTLFAQAKLLSSDALPASKSGATSPSQFLHEYHRLQALLTPATRG